ncbi:MAG TPA: indole-3-glycerol phosphate synthase TrpC [Solirubrobacteraceae bacterium]|jgi:indole-3-glycerol phosphate synthase|nr:indole-3-glycerol phosphate synthase TrpC [Solirubrobacteraceae bacterium]
MSVLADILASTRLELTRRKRAYPEVELRDLALAAGDAQRSLRGALSRPGIGVIAEFKRRSPSAGVLRGDADLAQIARSYERGGANALSVLTEGPNFDGSLEDLRIARGACGLPLLRKDFIVDPYQLYEARVAGADAVLLIVAALTLPELQALRELACGLGLDVLVEAHDAAELSVALDAGADLIGINNRDLRDFSVDLERTFALLAEIPPGVTVVSESGIGEPGQLARLQAAGVSAVLVGESLMRAPVPEEALRALRRTALAGAPMGVE